MKILGIIPSRYGSTRFPGKPLIDINGKSMIQRVYEQAQQAGHLTDVVVATDDNRIVEHVKKFNGKVILTSSHHESGTDRCAEVIEKVENEFQVVINIQGDEPFIDPEQINQLCQCFDDEQTDIATLIKKIDNKEELFNPNKPKVVIDENHFAMLFSRAAIPYLKEWDKELWLNKHTYFKHIGIYGYRVEVLKKIAVLPVSKLEKAEGLEQLRWLENGFNIKVTETTHEAISIDTPEDLEKITFK
ncbi:MAG: 3-deoxy-manno-octulosonate cytidylyltransferase [Vicingus serpentipes]|nr:3-deoxy-manno-octulosonate cytidylyltransferase [Vicingus serpentipes]